MKITPSLLQPKNVIVQGITGAHGAFHTAAMIAAGTNIVAGTSPNKAGQSIHNIPVYATIVDIKRDTQVDASVVFVPAPFAKSAIFEAINAEVPLIICITEGIPVHDMLTIHERLKVINSVLIGPNCPGIISQQTKLGIIPYNLTTPGTIGIVSRSGTLTYEAAASLTARGKGQRYVIGIGGDQIHGAGFIDCLELFESDPDVSSIVMIGEIGGKEELVAAEYIRTSVTKPVYGYVTGLSAPKNVQLGHAGAILGSEEESAHYKMTQLERVGVRVASSILELINSVE